MKSGDNVQEASEDMVSGHDQKKAFRVHFINFIIQNRALEGWALQDVSK